jgi:succinate dehydrogenase / fumarate reductase flavoprotein subunit
MSPEWRKVNLICSLDADADVTLRRQPIAPMRTDLLELFDLGELKKYMTEDELAGLPGTAEPAAGGTDEPGAGGTNERSAETSAKETH